jgi:Raf kinase inhibitor-like YbhB/YbcL family protein
MNPEALQIAQVRRKRRTSVVGIVFLVSLLAFVAAHQWRVRAAGKARSSSPVSSAPALSLTSSSFSNNGAIPRQFTCDGDDLSPNLQWSSAPGGTKSFALLVHDPDAPVDFTHWLVYRIPPDVHALAQNASSDGAMPRGSEEGINGFHSVGYAGPCPPPGKPHHYFFGLYALDVPVALPPGVKREEFEAAIRGHILAEGRIVGTYQRALF